MDSHKQPTLKETWATGRTKPVRPPIAFGDADVIVIDDEMETGDELADDCLMAYASELEARANAASVAPGVSAGQRDGCYVGRSSSVDPKDRTTRGRSWGGIDLVTDNVSSISMPPKSLRSCATTVVAQTPRNRQGQCDVAENLQGFDAEAGREWLYPTNCPVRDYQFNIVQKALFQNTLAVLPTGLGKTFIAAVVMFNFHRWYPKEKIVFMAPTRPLVAQQMEACYRVVGIAQEDTTEMTGAMPPAVRAKAWEEKKVVFLTPQVLTNDLTAGLCSPSNIKCLVFDEAHKAQGNHSYCQVIRDMLKQECSFRVLALSATPGSNVYAIQNVVRNLLISHIEIRTDDSLDIMKYVHRRSVEKVVVKLGHDIDSVQAMYMPILEACVSRLQRQRVLCNRPVTSISKFAVLQARNDFRQLPWSQFPGHQRGAIEGEFCMCITLYHGYELLMQHGLRSFKHYFDGIVKSQGNRSIRTQLMRNNEFSLLMTKLDNMLSPQGPGMVTGHPKLEKLEQIVIAHFQKCQEDGKSTRVIIFSQYRDSVTQIAAMMEHHHPLVKIMQFVGQTSAGETTKAFTQKDQLAVMKSFRDGGYNTLVSTCIGEEGLDIAEVDLIVCFDCSKSPLRLTQRMGRTGRKRTGRVVILVSEGKEEEVYNQCFSSKNAVAKTLQSGTRQLQFYDKNPRMIPRELQPVPRKTYFDIQPQVPVAPVRPAKTKGKKKSSKAAGISSNPGVENLVPSNAVSKSAKAMRYAEEEADALRESSFLYKDDYYDDLAAEILTKRIHPDLLTAKVATMLEAAADTYKDLFTCAYFMPQLFDSCRELSSVTAGSRVLQRAEPSPSAAEVASIQALSDKGAPRGTLIPLSPDSDHRGLPLPEELPKISPSNELLNMPNNLTRQSPGMGQSTGASSVEPSCRVAYLMSIYDDAECYYSSRAVVLPPMPPAESTRGNTNSGTISGLLDRGSPGPHITITMCQAPTAVTAPVDMAVSKKLSYVGSVSAAPEQIHTQSTAADLQPIASTVAQISRQDTKAAGPQELSNLGMSKLGSDREDHCHGQTGASQLDRFAWIEDSSFSDCDALAGAAAEVEAQHTAATRPEADVANINDTQLSFTQALGVMHGISQVMTGPASIDASKQPPTYQLEGSSFLAPPKGSNVHTIKPGANCVTYLSKDSPTVLERHASHGQQLGKSNRKEGVATTAPRIRDEGPAIMADLTQSFFAVDDFDCSTFVTSSFTPPRAEPENALCAVVPPASACNDPSLPLVGILPQCQPLENGCCPAAPTDECNVVILPDTSDDDWTVTDTGSPATCTRQAAPFPVAHSSPVMSALSSEEGQLNGSSVSTRHAKAALTTQACHRNQGRVESTQHTIKPRQSDGEIADKTPFAANKEPHHYGLNAGGFSSSEAFNLSSPEDTQWSTPMSPVLTTPQPSAPLRKRASLYSDRCKKRNNMKRAINRFPPTQETKDGDDEREKEALKRPEGPENCYGLLDDEADVSDNASADEDDASLTDMDAYEQSFINDVQESQSSYIDAAAMYIKSTTEALVGPRQGRFHLKTSGRIHKKSTSLYDSPQSPREDSDYEMDSFCVADETESFTSPAGCKDVLSKRAHVNPRRKRIRTPQLTSDSENEGTRNGTNRPSVADLSCIAGSPMSGPPSVSRPKRRARQRISSDEEPAVPSLFKKPFIAPCQTSLLKSPPAVGTATALKFGRHGTSPTSESSRDSRIAGQPCSSGSLAVIEHETAAQPGLIMKNRLSMFVTHKECCAAMKVMQHLRSFRWLEIVVTELEVCDYVVSSKMAVLHRTVQDLVDYSWSGPQSLVDKMYTAADEYGSCTFAIEAHCASGASVQPCACEQCAACARTGHTSHHVVEHLVNAAAIRHRACKVFFCHAEGNMASLLVRLVKEEHALGNSLCIDRNTFKRREKSLQYYKQLPGLRSGTALALCCAFDDTTSFLSSSASDYELLGRMEKSEAQRLHKHLQREYFRPKW